ncbi:hypothetical protein GCM10009827_061730 [Dactylosporangium maewongense]|uniref:Uncharacterized protein n=1 Tax=Dactylosporangium maewongense TaxID=634393 RepID=A0ABN2B9C1_9ACTN
MLLTTLTGSLTNQRYSAWPAGTRAPASRLTTAEPLPQPVEEERWDHYDPAESCQRLPRLAAMFPQAGPSQATPEAAQASLMQAKEGLERQLAESGRTLADFFRGVPPRTP